MKKKMTKKMAAFGMVMTMLFSMALVANAETTLRASDNVKGATVALSHTYSIANIKSVGSMSGYVKDSHISDTLAVTYKNNTTGKYYSTNKIGSGYSAVEVNYTRPSGNYTITSSRSDFSYRNNGSATRTKSIGA